MTSSALEIPSSVIAILWNAITKSKGEEIECCTLEEKLNEVLNNEELAERYVKEAISAELIVEVARKKQRGRQKASPSYTLPHEWESYAIPTEQPDKYCYECHLGGDVVKCDGCVRSFHVGCIKTADERQLELEQFVLKQKRITASAFKARKTSGRPRRASAASLAVTEESTNSSADLLAAPLAESSIELQLHAIECSDDVIMVDRQEGQVKLESNETYDRHIKREEQELKEEEDHPTDEAVFVCMVRPPNRRLERSLNTPTVKPEELLGEGGTGQAAGETNSARFCYACQLLRDGPNQVPPNVGNEDLNQLLKFVIERYKSWIPKDTFSTSRMDRDTFCDTTVLTRKTIEICKKMLLRTPTALADVREKTISKKYSSLEEFHIDLMDIVHNIAIIQGDNSIEYNAAMYMLGDCVYDLAEIRQCPDCYRHSSVREELWFAKPCRTRHELVFAKQNRRYQYWPAKVVRMQNNRYDVRFFGRGHARALVDDDCVKPIDTDIAALGVKTKAKGGFEQALKELREYQRLAECSRDNYAFTTERQEAVNSTGEIPPPPESLDANEVDRSLQVVKSTSRKRSRNANEPRLVQQRVPLDSVSPPLNSSGTDRSARAKRRQTIPQTPAPRPYRRNPEGTEPLDRNRKQNFRFPETYETYRLKQQFLKMEDLQETKQTALKLLEAKDREIERLREWMVDTHTQEISELKKKQWCVVCAQEARIGCCWNNSYCSTDCKVRHWPVHQKQHANHRNTEPRV